MGATRIEVVRLRPEQVERIADVLARAFWNDPQMLWLLPDAADRARLLPWLMRTSVRFSLRAGEVWTTPDLAGLALWLPPGAHPPGLAATLRSGAIAAPFKLGWERFNRFTTLAARADRLRKRVMREQHWHLAGLGVEPSAQRRGIASALLQPILARADASGIACYLETYTPANIAFYARLGFVVGAEEDVLAGAPHIWAMRRPARIVGSGPGT